MTTSRRKPSAMSTGLACASLLAGFLVSAAPVAAQMTSTAELKLACETSAGNTVNLNVNTQISSGPQPPLAEAVNTPCTLVLGPQVTFEADQVGMTFAGAFTIQGGTEARALFIESAFTAPSVTMNLAGSTSAVLVDRSLVRATAGSINITTGLFGNVDVRGPLAGGNLVATGAINVTGGEKAFVSLTDAGIQAGGRVRVTLSSPESSFTAVTSTVTAGTTVGLIGGAKFATQIDHSTLQAATGVNVTANGAEASIVSNGSTLNTTANSVNINVTGDKGFVELKLGAVATAGNAILVTLNGNESTLNANDFTFNGGVGNVNLQVIGSLGKATAAAGSIVTGGAVNIRASLASTYGIAVVQDADISAGTSLRVETGALGNTEAKDSILTASGLVRIATGAGGTCLQLNNTITGTPQQLCP